MHAAVDIPSMQCPDGSLYLTGLLFTYEYLFQLCGFDGSGIMVSGWVKWLR